MTRFPRPRLWPACLLGSAALAFAGCQSEDMRPTAYRNMNLQPGPVAYYGGQPGYAPAYAPGYGYNSPYAPRPTAPAPAPVMAQAPTPTGSPFPSREATPAAFNNLQAQTFGAAQLPPLTAQTPTPAAPVIDQLAAHQPAAPAPRPQPDVAQVQYTAPAAEAIKTERTPTREAAADHPRAVVEGFHSVARPLPKGPMVEVTGVSTPAPVVKTQPRPEPAAAVVLFTHAPDYTWIAGEMQHWRKSWRLRYTNLDETDAYGGSLTLVGDERLLRFRDGGHYRLQGRLVEDENLGGMAFQVEAVQPVE